MKLNCFSMLIEMDSDIEVSRHFARGSPIKNLFHNKIMRMEQPTLQIIGVLHGDIKSRGDAPKNFDESERVGTLEIYPEYQEGLEGIVPGQTIVVLFWLHQSGRDVLKVYPRGDTSRGLRGVFSTRSPVRPNPIAISELKVLAIHGNHIEVAGLDILDGTPIVDIKKLISR
jgi:tRNA (adenine37-N6)-methyltransferase